MDVVALTIYKTYFEAYESDIPVVEEIVFLGKSMGLEVDNGAINDLVKEHSEKLIMDRLLQLQE